MSLLTNGFDSDDSSEFINNQLLEYCTERKLILFTQSTLYGKNDQVHIDKKSYAVARRLIGYRSFDPSELFRNNFQIFTLNPIDNNSS